MGFAYAGDTGLVAGSLWAVICNYQRSLAYYKRPWTHAMGMAVCYVGFRTAAAWEDTALQITLARYESRGYVIPEDRKKLFEPSQYS